jgi:flagellar protein FliL
MSEHKNNPPQSKGKARLWMGAALALVVLGGGTAAYLSGLLPPQPLDAAAAERSAEPATRPAVFVDIPDLVVNVNVNVTGTRLRFLKLVASLEVAGEKQAEEVRRLLPRITDNINLYLRTVEPDQIGGAAGVYRIKRDLLARISQVVEPHEVRDVLIKEMLVQ